MKVKEVVTRHQLICVIKVATAQIFGLRSAIYPPPFLFRARSPLRVGRPRRPETRTLHVVCIIPSGGAAFVLCV